MVVLGIETAIMNRGSVSLLGSEKIIEEKYERGRNYQDKLWPAIDKVLKKTEVSPERIQGIAVSQGPGSFTGLRVGISVAKTLALSLKKPLLGIPTLEVLAQGLDVRFKKEVNLVIPILDAKRDLVYAAIFRRINETSSKVRLPVPRFRFQRNLWVERETDNLVLTIEEICRTIKEPAIFLGEGLKVYQKSIERELGRQAYFAPEEFFFPRASIVAQLGEEKLRLKKADNVYELQPIYLREPEISRKKKKI